MKPPSEVAGGPPWRPAAAWALGGVLFVLLATANAAGYRYGASDQAFYVPAVVRALDPASFPRDGSLLDAQARLMAFDDVLAGVVRTTGLPLDIVFFGAYLVSLAVLWCGLVLVGTWVYPNRWLTVALGAAFTLRHRIPQTSANSFEPYFSPRMLAFAVGLLAMAAVQRRRYWLATALVGLSAAVHVTTALWFAILLGVAMAVMDARFRRLAAAGIAVGTVFVVWAVAAGPLEASAGTMDDLWLRALASKDSLLPAEWPAWAWAANLGLLVVLWWAHLGRGDRRPENAALVWGATALGGVFLLTLPLVNAHVTLPTQLQISRVFWPIDLVATVYLVGRLAGERLSRRVAVALVAVSILRGGYVMAIEHPEREWFGVHLGETPWHTAMAWLARQPRDIHVLADPGHAWKYGTSVRVSAERDVFLEEVKDAAVAIYSRDVAARVVERTSAIGDFGTVTAARAQELGAHYDLDYLVTEADLPLPEAYRNEQFRIYRLGAGPSR